MSEVEVRGLYSVFAVRGNRFVAGTELIESYEVACERQKEVAFEFAEKHGFRAIRWEPTGECVIYERDDTRYEKPVATVFLTTVKPIQWDW